MFDSVTFDSVECDVSSVTIVGADAKWYQINVDTPYINTVMSKFNKSNIIGTFNKI